MAASDEAGGPDESDVPVVPDAIEGPGEASGLAGLFGEAGGEGVGLDFNALLEQATQVQQQMAEIQERAAQTVVEGVAGGVVGRELQQVERDALRGLRTDAGQPAQLVDEVLDRSRVGAHQPVTGRGARRDHP